MDVGVVCEEAFLGGVEEVGAVVYAGLLGGRAAEDFGAPGIAGGGVSGSFEGGKTRVDGGLQMAVKVDDGDGAVFSVDGTEKGEGDGVVSSESDQTRERLACL